VTQQAIVIDAMRLLVFPGLMAFAASSDLVTMTISNKVSLALVGGFLLVAGASGLNGSDIAMHLAAGGTVLLLGFICFACGWIGGGDAKLAAGTALWLGFEGLLPYLFVASLVGGGLTLLMLKFRQLPLPRLLQGQDWAERLHRKDAGVPYGVALAAAALLIYPESVWMKPLSP
jgi:prepilin peptidase CpaA